MKEHNIDFVRQAAIETLILFKKLHCISKYDTDGGPVFKCDHCLFNEKSFCRVNRFITKYGTNEQVKRMNDSH